MKKITEDFNYLFILWIIFAAALAATLFHHGHVLVDCGREVYYPVQILGGKVLYKDLFNIYGPFSYMFNSFLFKTFGVSLNVLYSAGSVCAFLILNLTYLISRKFLGGFLSFSTAVFVIAAGVLNLHVFNFIFPYSYAILYGLTAFLASVLCLLKYGENPEKFYFLYAGSLFAGVSAACKYEFLPYFLVVFYVIFKNRLKFSQYYYSILALFAIPVFFFGILFLEGLRMSDLLSSFAILSKMAQSQSLAYFYRHQGLYFSKNTFLLLLSTFFIWLMTFSGFQLGAACKNKAVSFFLISLASFIVLIWNPAVSLAFLPALVIALTIWDFKKIKNDFKLQILVLSSVIFSVKIFLGLILLDYGVYFAGFLLSAAFVLMKDKFGEERFSQKAAGVYILLLALNLGWHNLLKLDIKNLPLEYERGKIYTSKRLSEATEELIGYIDKNTKKTDRVVVFPEGLMINFFAQRQSDGFYNSLIPLYVEVFGEDKLISHFKNTKPEYIIFDNQDTSDYYFKYICKDYAVSFCNFVAKNYSHEKTIDKNGFRYLIFKRSGR